MFKKYFTKKIKAKEELHRKGLIELYEYQLERETESKFMKMVLKSAINKLKNTDIYSKKIEHWVVTLEKLWRKTKF